MKIAVLLLASLAAVTSAWQPMSRIPTRSVVRGAEDKFFNNGGKGRLGTSVDQDGKSNVWAVEPKMQVEVGKEGEGVMKGGIVAGGAVAALALAGVVVANLPDFDAI